MLDALNFVLHEKGLQKIRSSVIGNLVGGGAEAMIRRGYGLNKKIFDDDIKLMVEDFTIIIQRIALIKQKLTQVLEINSFLI